MGMTKAMQKNDTLTEVVDKIMNEEKAMMNTENSKSIILYIYIYIYIQEKYYIHTPYSMCLTNSALIQPLIACLLLASSL
jgi:hypothetical protein